jgi:hypothetical protein
MTANARTFAAAAALAGDRSGARAGRLTASLFSGRSPPPHGRCTPPPRSPGMRCPSAG